MQISVIARCPPFAICCAAALPISWFALNIRWRGEALNGFRGEARFSLCIEAVSLNLLQDVAYKATTYGSRSMWTSRPQSKKGLSQISAIFHTRNTLVFFHMLFKPKWLPSSLSHWTQPRTWVSTFLKHASDALSISRSSFATTTLIHARSWQQKD
jgi:hypothetical protein